MLSSLPGHTEALWGLGTEVAVVVPAAPTSSPCGVWRAYCASERPLTACANSRRWGPKTLKVSRASTPTRDAHAPYPWALPMRRWFQEYDIPISRRWCHRMRGHVVSSFLGLRESSDTPWSSDLRALFPNTGVSGAGTHKRRPLPTRPIPFPYRPSVSSHPLPGRHHTPYGLWRLFDRVVLLPQEKNLESPAPGRVSKVASDPPAGFFHPLPSPLPRRLSIYRMAHLATHPAGTSRRTGRFGSSSTAPKVSTSLTLSTLHRKRVKGTGFHGGAHMGNRGIIIAEA